MAERPISIIKVEPAVGESDHQTITGWILDIRTGLDLDLD